MKNIILLILFISVKTIAQNTITYNGPYEDSYGGYGNAHANYQYYENADYERIYHGDFSYKSTDSGNDRNSVTTIQGKFDNNKKVGHWVYSKEYNILKKYIIIEGNYINGLKNGQWSYFQKGLNNISTNGKTYFINFKNDTLIGEINIPGIKGNFNSNGEFIGEWFNQRGDREAIAEFSNNIIIKLIERKISTGEIYSKYFAPDELQNFSTAIYTDVAHRQSFEFSEILGFSGEKKIKESQIYAFKDFFKDVRSRIYSLQDNLSEFILLDNIIIKHPEVPVMKPYGREETKVEALKEQEIKKSYSLGIGLDGDGNYGLEGRIALNKEKFVQDCIESGIIKVYIEVNTSGQVINAIPGVEGSTSNAKCLYDPAKRAALATRFTSDPNAPVKQNGYIIYNFKLSE